MATTSPHDPNTVDPEFYDKDPYKQGDSDYGQPSEGVGNNSYKDSTSGMDMDAESLGDMQDSRDANRHESDMDMPTGESLGTTQEWEVNPEAVSEKPKGQMMSDEASKKLEQIAENPSDDALFHRQDATYLEQSDKPNEGYDPHNKGYDGKDKENAQ
jgi:hypothetical protein